MNRVGEGPQGSVLSLLCELPQAHTQLGVRSGFPGLDRVSPAVVQTPRGLSHTHGHHLGLQR